MKDHTDCKRSYIRSSKTYYADKSRNISVNVGMYHDDGSTSGEFEFEWVPLGSKKLSPKLKCFDDAWHALIQFTDLLEMMAEIDSEDIQEPEFCKMLDDLKILDITEYKQK